MTSMKSIVGILAVLTALVSCSQMTECAMETKPVPPVTKAKEKIWSCGLEQMPSFPGGQKALLEYLTANVRYPDDCEDTCVQGRVIVSFMVERDGSLSEAKVMKSVYPSLDEEALRVVNSMPK